MSRRAPAYDAVIAAPFGHVAIKAEDGRVVDINFVSARTPLVASRDPFVRDVCRTLEAYFRNPKHPLRIPVTLNGSEHQRRVWRALTRIPSGEVRSYGELARELGSSPRAVGGACRRNPIPLIVPCHRVVGTTEVGGFMGQTAGSAVKIKRWLLDHEQRE